MTPYGRVVEDVDLTLIRGNAVSFTFRFKDGGSALDLTGKTIIFRGEVGSTVIRLTTAAGLAIATPANGEVVVSLTAAQTRSIPLRRPMPYEIEDQAAETTLVKGEIIATDGVNDDA